MYELRKDILLGRWVAVAKESKAPEEYEAQHENNGGPSCVLCAGREAETRAEITSLREDNKWRARVIPNFNPILQVEGELGRKGIGMYDKMNNIGANEIVIECPEHDKRPEDIGLGQMLKVITLYRERVADLERDTRLRYALIYKNSGKAAGAEFTHSHSEIIATPVIPNRIKGELDSAKQYYGYKERCIFCDIIREELRVGDRVIFETRDFIAFTLFAPRFPFEFWILPKRHSCAFQEINPSEMEDLSLMLTTMLKKMRKILKEPPYNYFIHTAPNRVPRRDHWHTLGEDYHWHLEVLPRLFRRSGFEWGSGFYIITTSPEDAAKYYREA